MNADTIDIVLIKEALTDSQDAVQDPVEELKRLKQRNKEMRKGIKRLFMLIEQKEIELPIYLYALYEDYKKETL